MTVQENEFIEVPILDHFNMNSPPIGIVKIKKSFLLKEPNWVLSPGYRILNNKTNEYEILCFGLILDTEKEE